MTEENKTATASEDSEVVNFEVDQESFKVKPPDGNRAFISVWDDVLSESECSNIIEKFFGYFSIFIFFSQIFYKGNSVIMPVIELFNHSNVGRPFIFNGGIEIQGKGSGEIFSRYHSAMDGFDFFNLFSLVFMGASIIQSFISIGFVNFSIISLSYEIKADK